MVYAGVFPIAPTTFAENGDLDRESQRRLTASDGQDGDAFDFRRIPWRSAPMALACWRAHRVLCMIFMARTGPV